MFFDVKEVEKVKKRNNELLEEFAQILQKDGLKSNI